MMQQIKQGDIRGWLQFGLTLLIQTALVAMFVYGEHVELTNLKESITERLGALSERLNKSEADRAAIHGALESYGATQYRLGRCESELAELNQRVNEHIRTDR